MKERIEFYYHSQISKPWCDLPKIQKKLKMLGDAGVSVTVTDTASMTDEERYEHYATATYPSVRKQYRIRQIFGSQNQSGQFFGKQQPALLVYHGKNTQPSDVYPHDENGVRIQIEDFLEGQIKALKLESEAPLEAYEVLDRLTCSVEAISGKYAYLRLRHPETDDDRDYCLEYPLPALQDQVGNVSEGMFLWCEIREFDDGTLAFHFEKSEPVALSVDERRAILDKYRTALGDAEG